MATSVVYSSIFAAVMAFLPGLDTKLVCFDTSVVDLTEMLEDPVDVLFGVQLGGGTDINRALTDDGRTWHDEANAKAFAALGCPVFACTPDQLPNLMAAALRRQDIGGWAAERDIALVRG